MHKRKLTDAELRRKLERLVRKLGWRKVDYLMSVLRAAEQQKRWSIN